MERMFMFVKAIFLILTIISPQIECDSHWNLDEDTEGWIDPHSMLEDRKERTTKTENNGGTCTRAESDCKAIEEEVVTCRSRTEKLKTDLEKQKELYRKMETIAAKEQPFFEQYIRHILTTFKSYENDKKKGHYEVDILLSSMNYGSLSNYVAQKQEIPIQEVHSVLLKMIKNIRWVNEDDEFDEVPAESIFYSYVLYCLNVVAVGIFLLIGSLHAVSLMRQINISLSRFLFLILFFFIVSSFVISIPWTWWHLYKKEVAKRMQVISRGPGDCESNAKSFWATIASMIVIQSDHCQEYFELLEIDPLWAVPPTQAVAVTLTRFFLEPARHVGRAIREFMVAAFEGLPMFLWFPVFALIILLIILILFCLGGYRISSPLLRIEPMRPDGSTAELEDQRRRVRQLENDNDRLQRMLGHDHPMIELHSRDQRHPQRANPSIMPGVQDVFRDYPDSGNSKKTTKVETQVGDKQKTMNEEKISTKMAKCKTDSSVMKTDSVEEGKTVINKHGETEMESVVKTETNISSVIDYTTSVSSHEGNEYNASSDANNGANMSSDVTNGTSASSPKKLENDPDWVEITQSEIKEDDTETNCPNETIRSGTVNIKLCNKVIVK